MNKGKKNLISVIAIVVLIVLSILFLNKDKDLVQVEIMEATIGSVSKTIEFSGTVNSSNFEEITVLPNSDVLNIYVKENDLVKEGQLLAELDSTELLISLEKAQISLEQLRTDLDLEEKGANSSEKDILSNSLERSKEELKKIKKDLELSNENLVKAKNLYDENAISKAEYDKQVSSTEDLESSLKTAELNYNDANTKYNDYFDNNKQNIESLERQIKSQLLDIESLNNKIEKNKIYSTIAGVVTEFPLSKSKQTTTNDKIVIYDTNSYEFVAKVAQEDAVFIKEGQKSTVFVKGILEPYDGVVTQIGQTAEIDVESGSKTPKVEIKIKIVNPNNSIASGFDGDAKVEIDSKDNVLTVKNECIKKEDDNKKYLFVVDNKIAKKVYIETDLSNGYITSVIAGIEENDMVVINPSEQLIDGMTVKITK
ncbi:HlyD family secretion protein [Sedimentibacter acidaminivorans]|uniref:HlyD family secretion protein n=1 Tax=Sedimentibacter acidaminivorans TaxID=913099 RepID=A0ABS4G9I5_9FIRM|nr:biotin/lipoyl-binding protein [Sedimentibacter acidaminivorans]MBP1924356.1 HlyD family secretion protein [Sedimentibacter acidaminivorans]